MRIIRGILSWALWLTGAVVVAFVINRTILVNAMVISGSMENTIMTNDRVMGNRLSYLFREPERLDVIVFMWPDDPDELPFVKRIIGLPGEKIEIVDGKVYIDDNIMPLDERFYLPEEMRGSYGPYDVPDGTYFVLGDNRNKSKDSRDWIEKFVPEKNILGKVVLRIFPALEVIK
ncbi:MAG: signal peptidase I [Defluviitaleaceae bacterium]|nr:signal peptidase I [Defluviitaleaceae bacterium]MCL2835553.1 signal peptidase I [Defluviitaleaceae bacterium]